MDFRLTLAVLPLLAACGGNPLLPDDDTGTTDPDDEATASTSIRRYEDKDGSGGGYVSSVTYSVDAEGNETFKVDGLAFDGDNQYVRGTAVGALGSVKVFEGKPRTPDGFTGTPIGQITPHRALYGVNSDGTMSFAVVRTGGYVDYGFGGFVYERTGGVTLPAEGEGTAEYKGQAHYSGTTAGLRDFKNRGGLEYSTADMTMDIDFDDFNDGNAVKGRIFNRRVFDMNGNEITASIVSALSGQFSDGDVSELPQITFVVESGVMDSAGEIQGTLISNVYSTSGVVLDGFETGNYYAIVGGKNAENVVGIFVVEADDPRWDGVTVRETGGFTLVRE